MHIGFVTPEYVTGDSFQGGLANYLHRTAHSIAARGHRVSLFCFSSRDGHWTDGEVAVYEVKRLLHTQKKWRMAGQYAGFIDQLVSSWRLRRILWKIHRETPLDLIQAAGYYGAGFFLRKNGKVPFICRISSYSPMWRAAAGRGRSFGDHLSDWLEVRQIVDADAAFSPSAFLARTIERFEGRAPDIVRTPIDDFPDHLDFSFYEKHLAGMRYLLYAGSLNRTKGIDLLGGVLPSLFEIHRDLRFVFAGRDDGYSNDLTMTSYLRRSCGRYEDRLVFSDGLPKPLLFAVMSRALAVVIPSRVDNCPNVSLEAQALGVPVIGTKDSSLEEMIADGETGFLAENDSAESLGRAIDRVLRLEATARREIESRIRQQSEQIRAEDRVGSLLQYYSSVIEAWRSTAPA